MLKNCKIIFFRMDDGRSHASSGTKRENKLVDKEVEALIEVIFELFRSIFFSRLGFVILIATLFHPQNEFP